METREGRGGPRCDVRFPRPGALSQLAAGGRSSLAQGWGPGLSFWGEGGRGRTADAGRGVGWVLMRGQEPAKSGRDALAGRPPTPAPPGLIRFVWSGAGLPAVPRARSRGRGAQRRGNFACLVPTPLFPFLAQNFFGGFKSRGGDLY